jgi:small-conductance mechanosensitive channel
LMSFPAARNLGASVLASAGIAGLAVGLAVRPLLENILAGIQLAITQPIRIEDVVIVEKEWGRIEEITTTYVVVRTWDLRRLVLPLTYFIEKPFENWTRTSSEIIGTIFWYVDYNADVESIREEFNRIVASSPRWNRKAAVLQVTDATEQTLQLRGLVSANNASDAWDLRCDVREALLTFIQRHPRLMPRMRTELTAGHDGLLPKVDGDARNQV